MSPITNKCTGNVQFSVNDCLGLLATSLMRRVRHVNEIVLICWCACVVGCIEKIKIGILIWPSNRQVPFDMGSKKVQKYLKIFHVLRCPQRAKVFEKL